ncbi:MAG: hypothetical protein IPN68_07095 [Bacteroidetes bacterium]|nr:hypothetical protein [Bacteroidota bacterium]
MRKLFTTFIVILFASVLYGQVRNTYQTGITADENLKAISNLSAFSIGGIGFDTRYKGVIGSPMLFDTLLISYLKISKQEKYIEVPSNIDLVTNSVICMNPKTKQLISIPGNKINELIIRNENNDMIFRTMSNEFLNKKTGEHIFYQVLNDDNYKLIKVPSKDFIEANYKQAYSPGRGYDEFVTTYKYYIISPDGAINQCQLSEKSIIKIFPKKKELIKNIIKEKILTDKEAMVIEILKNF